MKKAIEILSPGKNLEYSKQAILCGADSIYIGAPRFSLRHEQANSLNDIKELVDFAHRYWVKIYVPINCLLFSEEDINYTKELINELYEIGVDGLIVQDIGILELDLPPLPIILSTNAMCFTKEDAQFFEKCGVKRIVLPRELTFEEIKEIKENSNIEIETFCYGFLCVGYSGNCYLSYVEHLKKTESVDNAHYNASNHGVCPERCMGNWTLRDAKGDIIRENDRLLNLRFLCLDKEIERLFDIGIDSFKIAGREKDLKHVKNSTAIFSQIANEIAKKKGIKRLSSGRTILGFEPDLSKNFNKGFTDFFLNGRKKEMYSKYHLVGTPVGIAKDFVNSSFVLDNSQIKLNIGDKLRYKIGNEIVKTIEITDVKYNRYYIKSIGDNIENCELYRYIDVKGFEEVEKSVNYRVISVNLNIEDKGESYLVCATDEDNNQIQTKYPKGSVVIAQSDIKDKLYKLDVECEFIIDSVNSNDIYIDNIAKFRDEIFEKLRAERLKNRPVDRCTTVKNNVPFYKKKLNYLRNVTNKYTADFYKRHCVEEIEPGLETNSNLEGKRVFSARYCLRNELGYCSKYAHDNIPPFPWTIEQLENGNKFKIEFDCKNCSMYFYTM